MGSRLFPPRNPIGDPEAITTGNILPPGAVRTRSFLEVNRPPVDLDDPFQEFRNECTIHHSQFEEDLDSMDEYYVEDSDSSRELLMSESNINHHQALSPEASVS